MIFELARTLLQRLKRAGHPNLRPNSDDQRDADVEQPVGTQTKANGLPIYSSQLEPKTKPNIGYMWVLIYRGKASCHFVG